MVANGHLGATGRRTNYYVGVHEAGATTCVEIGESLTRRVRHGVTKLHGDRGAKDDRRPMSKWRQCCDRRAATIRLGIATCNIAGCTRSRGCRQPHIATSGSKWPFNCGRPDGVWEINYFTQRTSALGREQFEDVASCACAPPREEVRGHRILNGPHTLQVSRRVISYLRRRSSARKNNEQRPYQHGNHESARDESSPQLMSRHVPPFMKE